MTRASETLTPPNALQQKDMPPAAHQEAAAVEASPGPVEQQWIRICAVDEIPRLGARVLKRASGPNIAIFRTATDGVFALADSCPHRGGPLSQGIVFGERVACPLHNTCVELDTGCAVAPDKGEVRRYAVKVEEASVFVDLEVRTDDRNG
jgi:nitrite reductase (NADH) small subunit